MDLPPSSQSNKFAGVSEETCKNKIEHGSIEHFLSAALLRYRRDSAKGQLYHIVSGCNGNMSLDVAQTFMPWQSQTP